MRQNKVIDSFFIEYPLRLYDKGHVLVRPGQNFGEIHYIKAGQIEQYDLSAEGNKVIVNAYGPGSYIPMSAVFRHDSDMWFYEAATECEVHVTPIDDVRELMRSNNAALFSFAENLCSGALGQQRRMAHLMGGSAANRLLYELIVTFKRFGSLENGVLTVRTTDAELASSSGLSRETVSRGISKLKKEGYVDRRYKMITTSNISRLEQELGFRV